MKNVNVITHKRLYKQGSSSSKVVVIPREWIKYVESSSGKKISSVKLQWNYKNRNIILTPEFSDKK